MAGVDIIESVIPIFKVYGVKSITMDDISHKLGISKKTLYVYYKGKEDLVEQSVKATFVKHHVVFQRILRRDILALKKIILLYRYGIRQLTSYSTTFYLELKKYYPNAYLYYQNERSYITFTIILDLLKEAQQAGEILEEVNLELYCKLNMDKIDTLLLDVKLHNDYSISEIVDHLVIYSLRGILAEKNTIKPLR
ncbi:TetR/AcrR family transcriptional regulator [Winogradskyella vidalii]|uniref:TetR/AcrR family transcriptional regulator n=1 Tax=Winogradskyella vidalii TaxID=2615024 RepID=UPI0015C7503D|nr:TetR/AcrR family transcriptional regulator [Winogradskyella vidalii]